MYSPATLELISSLEQKACDDCGKKEVEWASVKKGTIICSECFCFHSYLGPSVSYLRHLRKSAWDEEHIRLVHTLHSSNTNRIWESAICDGSTKFTKPEPQDPAHIKERFVKEKYEKMTFQPKRSKDEDENNLSKELIACARSDYAHVSLRYIALGADVNYTDPETGDTALHVAAREGNANQVELLFLYGADIMAQNKDGQLPYLVAKDSGHGQLAQRIFEFFFYVFDRFSFFMCNRKADHKNNQDFFIPEVTEKQFLIKTKDSRAAISALSKPQFFDLCEDAFDETVRRENEANWITTKWAKTAKGPTNLFLPPTPQMSAARNQRRQKLAKFTPIQFTILLIDLIKDQKRRINGDNPLPVSEAPKSSARRSNDTPLRIMKKQEYADYDEVAGISCSPISGILPNSQAHTLDESNSRVWDELLEMKERLSLAENSVLTLTKQNEDLTKIVHSLQAQNINLNSELISFRDDMYQIKRTNMTRRMPSPLAIVEQPERTLPPQALTQTFPRRDSEDRIDCGGARWRSNSGDRRNSNDHRLEKKVERRQDSMMESSSSLSRSSQNPTTMMNREDIKNIVIQKSEKITRLIKTLLKHGQNGNLDINASHSAHEIACASNNLIGILPSHVRHDKIDSLTDAVVFLNAKCNSPLLMPMDIVDAAQNVAEKLRMIIMELV